GDTAFFRRAHLFPDGRLIALYQTAGLVFLDRSSRPLGRCPGNFYNDFWIGGDGRIWTLAKEARPAGDGAYRLDDFLVLLRHQGDGEGCREERRISITGAFRDSAFAHLLEPMAPAGDALHANTVEELDGSLGARSPLFAQGNLLVSLRQLDLIAIVDPEAETVVWARRGPWKRQHEPSLLPSGRILLFDNRGHRGFSRLLEVDPLSGELEWTWQGDPPASFASSIAGTCVRLPGGTTLVTESVPGRAFELDAQGRIVWDFRSPHRAGPGGGLVAMLFEVQRLPAGYLRAFLE
ncbi:MAG TPA: arylsulfotransferase family protein, partial [Thermoanaerobaculia bacterium]|nr:arylsulfotransferase family protein [Thermoanaerobaculia bacterium]